MVKRAKTYVVWCHLETAPKCGHYNHCYLCIVENGILYEVDKNMTLTIRAFPLKPYFELIKESPIEFIVKEVKVEHIYKKKDKIKIIEIIKALWHTFHIILQIPYKLNYSTFSCVETTKAFLGIIGYHIYTPEGLYKYLLKKGFIVGDLFGGGTAGALKNEKNQQKKAIKPTKAQLQEENQQKKQLSQQKAQLQNEKYLLERAGTGYNPLFDFGKKKK